MGSALSAGNDPSDIYAAIRDGLEKKLSPLRIQAEGSRSTQEALKIDWRRIKPVVPPNLLHQQEYEQLS